MLTRGLNAAGQLSPRIGLSAEGAFSAAITRTCDNREARVMAEDSYFQFSLCALAHGRAIDERFQDIIGYCVREVGEAIQAKLSEEMILKEIGSVHEDGGLPPDFKEKDYKHIAVVLGAKTTNVRIGTIAGIIGKHNSLRDFIRRFDESYGRSPLVRIKTQFVWDVLNSDGLTSRELTILCAVYSCIGANERPVRITKKTIRHRMLGYKSEAIMKGQLHNRQDRAKPLTERQIITTLDKLHSRGFFARMRANARQTYYSHRLKQEEPKKALYEMKTRQTNPEDFIIKASRIIKEQKATVIIEHLAYSPVGDKYTLDIFTQEKEKDDFSKAVKTDRHIYDYVFTDSQNERKFVKELDSGAEVVVYAKLPRGFFIPTPVGDYNPDWAIAFQEGTVKHIYFIAETKGSLSSMDLRKIEECKIDCARKFFAKITSDQVKYDVVDSYNKLMELVK